MTEAQAHEMYEEYVKLSDNDCVYVFEDWLSTYKGLSPSQLN